MQGGSNSGVRSAGVAGGVGRVGAEAGLLAVEGAVAVGVGILTVGAPAVPLGEVGQTVTVAVGVGRQGALAGCLFVGQAVLVVVGREHGQQLAVEVEVFLEEVAGGVGLGQEFAAGAIEEVVAVSLGVGLVDALAEAVVGEGEGPGAVGGGLQAVVGAVGVGPGALVQGVADGVEQDGGGADLAQPVAGGSVAVAGGLAVGDELDPESIESDPIDS